MEEFFSRLLRYGMFLGAIFQLVCIAAVIILPEQIKSHRVSMKESYQHYSYANKCYINDIPRLISLAQDNGQFEYSDSESDSTTHVSRKLHNHHRIRKQDKKKRR